MKEYFIDNPKHSALFNRIELPQQHGSIGINYIIPTVFRDPEN